MKNVEAKTKYVVLVGDGMADYPLPELGGKTPLQAANTPNMDRIASCRVGLVRTIPDGMDPGSDVANLSLLGYDPRVYHTRRAPFEAASMQVELKPDEVAFRMNLVTLDFKPNRDIVMVSHSSGDLPSRMPVKSWMVSRRGSSFPAPPSTRVWDTAISWFGKTGLKRQ